MDIRKVVSRLLVPLLLFAGVLVIVFLAREPRTGDTGSRPGLASGAGVKSGKPESTELPAMLPAARQPANQSEVSSKTESTTPTTYAPAERWRKTAMPCWGLRGTGPEDFDVEVDTSIYTAGKSSASLTSIGSPYSWGTLYQFADAGNFRGKRIEFSADVRTAAVELAANLLVRADDAQGNAVAMDNMWYSSDGQGGNENRVNQQFTGDTDWTTRKIVLDIPANAAVISYGVALDGPGKVWIDNARIEPTTADTPTTAYVRPESELKAIATFVPAGNAPLPRNLDFEQTGSTPGCE